jgi:glycerol-3-phosphate O-acyltransferase
VLRLVWRRLTGRYYRFGYACVSFGEPLSLLAFLADRPGGEVVAELGAELSSRIGRVIPVLPVSLMASVFLASGRALSMIDVKVAAAELLDRLHAAGAHSHVPRANLDYAVEVGMRMLVLRRIIVEDEAGFRVVAQEAQLLGYYANSIGHLVAAGAPVLTVPPA